MGHIDISLIIFFENLIHGIKYEGLDRSHKLAELRIRFLLDVFVTSTLQNDASTQKENLIILSSERDAVCDYNSCLLGNYSFRANDMIWWEENVRYGA
jgi:hypothetical protein